MEFKVEKKSIRVVVGDVVYEMKVPSVMQQMKNREEIKKAESEDSIKIMAEYLIMLGLAREVVESLDSDTFLDLYTFIHSSKKNLPATN